MPPTTENTIQRHPKITVPQLVFNFGIQEYITRFFLTECIFCVLLSIEIKLTYSHDSNKQRIAIIVKLALNLKRYKH